MTNPKVFQEARVMLCRYLSLVAAEKGITQQQIAEETGFTRNNVSRMFSGKYSPSLDNFMKLAQACGCYFFVEDKGSPSDAAKLMRERWKRKGDEN